MFIKLIINVLCKCIVLLCDSFSKRYKDYLWKINYRIL